MQPFLGRQGKNYKLRYDRTLLLLAENISQSSIYFWTGFGTPESPYLAWCIWHKQIATKHSEYIVAPVVMMKQEGISQDNTAVTNTINSWEVMTKHKSLGWVGWTFVETEVQAKQGFFYGALGYLTDSISSGRDCVFQIVSSCVKRDEILITEIIGIQYFEIAKYKHLIFWLGYRAEQQVGNQQINGDKADKI